MCEQRWQISGGSTNTLSQYIYGYDDGGNRKWVKRANGKGDVFRYDALDQITNVLYEATNPDASPSAWTNEGQYTYDAAGSFSYMNITNSGEWAFAGGGDNLNRYYNVLGSGVPGGGGFTYSYDKNGNQTTDPTGWGFNYDRQNRLLMATNATTSVTNTYDAFNRLVERQVGANKTRFIYDQWWRVIAEYSELNTLIAKYVYGPGIDEVVRMRRNGTNYSYRADALGNITEISADLNIVERYSYDAYGAPTIYNSSFVIQPSSLVSNRFLFQGRDRDPDTGLYNFRNRYYHPTLGRFVQVDPIREYGGLNLYSFAENNPVNKADPTGTLAIIIPIIIGGFAWWHCNNLLNNFRMGCSYRTTMARLDCAAKGKGFIPSPQTYSPCPWNSWTGPCGGECKEPCE